MAMAMFVLDARRTHATSLPTERRSKEEIDTLLFAEEKNYGQFPITRLSFSLLLIGVTDDDLPTLMLHD